MAGKSQNTVLHLVGMQQVGAHASVQPLGAQLRVAQQARAEDPAALGAEQRRGTTNRRASTAPVAVLVRVTNRTAWPMPISTPWSRATARRSSARSRGCRGWTGPRGNGCEADAAAETDWLRTERRPPIIALDWIVSPCAHGLMPQVGVA